MKEFNKCGECGPSYVNENWRLIDNGYGGRFFIPNEFLEIKPDDTNNPKNPSQVQWFTRLALEEEDIHEGN